MKRFSRTQTLTIRRETVRLLKPLDGRRLAAAFGGELTPINEDLALVGADTTSARECPMA